MPTVGQVYFLNGPSFSTTTSIFLDSDLSICAPDGYYTDGIIVRRQIDCVLYPAEECPDCATDCPIDSIPVERISFPVAEYKVSFDAGSAIGAIVIIFDPAKYFDGIKIEYNSLTYNAISCENYGYLAAPSGLATFVGDDAYLTPEGCQLDGETFILDEYTFDGITFNSTGNTDTITVDASQNKLTASNPGNCYIVIPKTTATPSVINATIYSTCTESDFGFYAACPSILPSVMASIKQLEVTYPASCTIAINQTYFYVHVNGSGGALDLYDWVFQDQYGAVPLADGYYRCDDLVSDDTFRIENGVIVELLTVCS